MLTGHQKSIGSLQTIPQKPTRPKYTHSSSRLFCHTAHTRAHLISCVGREIPPPHIHTHFTCTFFAVPLDPQSAQSHCHGPTFDPIPCPPRHLVQGSNVTRDRDMPTYCQVRPTSKVWIRNVTPNRKQ